MARPKKDGKYVNFYIDSELLKRLKEYCEETGLSKTAAIERFIAKGLEKEYKKQDNQNQRS